MQHNNNLVSYSRCCNVDRYDSYFITKTWLHGGGCSRLLDPNSDYNILRKDRTVTRNGAVCVCDSQKSYLVLTVILVLLSLVLAHINIRSLRNLINVNVPT